MSKEKKLPKNELVEQGEKIVKKKAKNREADVPQLIKGAKAEDVRRIGNNLLYWYGLPPAVTDDEIRERILHYFERTLEQGELLTWEALALSLGYTRQTLWRWENGEEGSTPTRRYLIKKAKELLATFDAQMATEGKINPVTYIFRAKNYFGMRDQQEYVLTPNNPLGDTSNPNDIQRRISESIADE